MGIMNLPSRLKEAALDGAPGILERQLRNHNQ